MVSRLSASNFYLLLAVLAAWPLAVGPNPWAWTYFAASSFLLFTVWVGVQAGVAAPLPDSLTDYRSILWAAFAVLAYQAVKALPIWPSAFIDLVSPVAAGIYDYADVGGSRIAYSLSLDSGLALREVIRVAAYFAVFFLILGVVNSQRQVMLLANVLLLTVFIVALWGLLEFFGVHYGKGRAAGVFGNANYFAGFLELGLGLAAGLLYARDNQTSHSAMRGRLIGLIDWVMSWRAKLALVFVVLLGALFASGSRGGTLAFLVALLISGFLIRARQQGASQSHRFILTLTLISVTTVVWLGADALLARIGQGHLDQAARLSYWRSGLQMALDYPVFGMGGGSWRYAYALYRDPELPAAALPLHAHNDHVQMLTEHGVIGYLLMGIFVYIALKFLVRALRERRDRFVRGIVFGSLVSSLSLLFHALTDNNFQVAPTTAYFFAILGLGLAAARLPSRESVKRA